MPDFSFVVWKRCTDTTVTGINRNIIINKRSPWIAVGVKSGRKSVPMSEQTVVCRNQSRTLLADGFTSGIIGNCYKVIRGFFFNLYVNICTICRFARFQVALNLDVVVIAIINQHIFFKFLNIKGLTFFHTQAFSDVRIVSPAIAVNINFADFAFKQADSYRIVFNCLLRQISTRRNIALVEI